MMSSGFFLCGCPVKGKLKFSVPRGAEVAEENIIETVEFQRDHEGFKVCPDHGAREYGWASPSITGPQGNNVLDWGAMGNKSNLKLPKSDTPDLRPTVPTEQEVASAVRDARLRLALDEIGIGEPDDDEQDSAGLVFCDNLFRVEHQLARERVVG
jgi:hypothetical protein